MAKRYRKKKTFLSLVSILLVVAILVGLYLYLFKYKGYTWDTLMQAITGETPSNDNEGPSGGNNIPSGGVSVVGSVQTQELTVQFLELGVKYVGDSTLIKVDNTEILIDAGANNESAETLVPYISQYCTDGVLEYVIATHAHEDHIGAFYSVGNRKGIFDSFEVKTIIDFARTEATSKAYQRYVAARENEVALGAVHYTALQCWNETDGAKRSYVLGENITLNILYQKFYEQKSSEGENDYSVCVLLTQGDYNYLFTGDLEEAGEKSLVDSNNLPHCEVFKGGHHGSSTSNTDYLFQAITPDNICICTCAGSPQYTKTPTSTFPTQRALDRMAKYTQNIYVTSVATNVDYENKEWEIVPLNGTITVKSDGVGFAVIGSNHSTILKDTEWFEKNRIWNPN